ncbi:unnamed protein product [Clonostachys byssicola]|uniref:Uncharacterized protein n=1 Tax=Clonostachys byssicola TaxID=160290 RepID=A0A9N9YCV6_9HYPO|nr:unnamed protein product [Clonostachys byssicola]
MKAFTVTAASLAVVASALPQGSGQQCTPATYSCTPDNQGWQVCNTSGTWVFAGNCPPKTICKFDQQNQSPYCVAPNVIISGTQ